MVKKTHFTSNKMKLFVYSKVSVVLLQFGQLIILSCSVVKGKTAINITSIKMKYESKLFVTKFRIKEFHFCFRRAVGESNAND